MTTQALPSSTYVRALKDLLPAKAFAPDASVLLVFALHLAVIVLAITALAHDVGGAWARLPWALLIGHSFTGVAFVGHEVLHGSVLRSRRLSHWLGAVCLLPFTVSPSLWKKWHNQIHHGNTMIAGVDPDCYPTVERYRQSAGVRLFMRFALARGTPLGFISIVGGFSMQHLQVVAQAYRERWFSRWEFVRVLVEMGAGMGLWALLGVWLGAKVFLFAYAIPLLVANTVAMAYILTNHHLNPLNDVNDPLLNSLTVTVPRPLELLHSRFGLHVEHHLFPGMSSRYAPQVRELILQKWPERYQSMPLLEALRQLGTTPRTYGAPTVLEDPRDGLRFPTLLPRYTPSAESNLPRLGASGTMSS